MNNSFKIKNKIVLLTVYFLDIWNFNNVDFVLIVSSHKLGMIRFSLTSIRLTAEWLKQFK